MVVTRLVLNSKAMIKEVGFAMLIPLIMTPSFCFSEVLPEERADVMYHRYDGGGMVIDGPSVLVRKNFADKISVSGNYYVDNVSSASIDVQTIASGASEYTEKRTEKSGDITYLHDTTTLNLGFTTSSENDYEAESYRFDISHSFFSELTTINAGYSQGNDDITSSDEEDFAEKLERRHYRVGIAQILSKSLIVNLNYESIVDDGYLQNPYRRILYAQGVDSTSAGISSVTPYERRREVYPRSRNSDAVSLKFSYHLPWPAAIKSRFGYFSDSWGIDGYSVELDYSHKFRHWLFDLRARRYEQNDAEFYANLFYDDTINQNFLGRDKELSQYSSVSLGIGARREWRFNHWIDKISINGQFDYLFFDYENFREVTIDGTELVGGIEQEPLYEFDAYVARVFLTLFY